MFIDSKVALRDSYDPAQPLTLFSPRRLQEYQTMRQKTMNVAVPKYGLKHYQKDTFNHSSRSRLQTIKVRKDGAVSWNNYKSKSSLNSLDVSQDTENRPSFFPALDAMRKHKFGLDYLKQRDLKTYLRGQKKRELQIITDNRFDEGTREKLN